MCIRDRYDPLAKDTDNDGIPDRYDNNFKDSDYFESTFDVEDQELEARNLKEVKVKLKEKQKQKYADEFRKKQAGKEFHQEGSKKKNYSNEGFTRNRGKEDVYKRQFLFSLKDFIILLKNRLSITNSFHKRTGELHLEMGRMSLDS